MSDNDQKDEIEYPMRAVSESDFRRLAVIRGWREKVIGLFCKQPWCNRFVKVGEERLKIVRG